MPLHQPHANVRKMFPLSEEPSHDRRLSVVVHRVAVLRLRLPPRHSFRNRFGRFRIRSLSDRSRGGTVRGARHARTGSRTSLLSAYPPGYDGIAFAFAILPWIPFGIRY